jgi:hypothetical protein
MSSKNCPVCNASVPDGAAFCPNCGANLQSPTPSTPNQYPQYQAQQPTQPTPPPPPPPQQPQRPTGVVILTILEVIAAVYTLFAGAAAGTLLAFAAPVLAGLGGLFILIGLVELLLAWGLYTGKNWARIVAIIFAILGLLAIPIGTIISIIILYYLTRPHVKAFFGVR